MPDKGYRSLEGKDLLRKFKRDYKSGKITYKQLQLLIHKHNLTNI